MVTFSFFHIQQVSSLISPKNFPSDTTGKWVT